MICLWDLDTLEKRCLCLSADTGGLTLNECLRSLKLFSLNSALGLNCVTEKAEGFLRHDVRGVPAFMTTRRILATLLRAITVLGCVRIKHKV